MNFLRAMSLLAALIISLSASVSADLFLKQKLHTESYKIMGQTVPASEQESSTWIGKDKFRIDRGPDTSMIIHIDKNIMYMLDHKAKNVVEVPLGDMQKAVGEALAGSEDMSQEEQDQAMAMMKGMQSMMQIKFEVTETDETKKIGSWNSRKYIVVQTLPMGGKAESEMWVSQDIKADYSYYNKVKNTYLTKLSGIEASVKEFEKIKGMPVLMITSTSMMGAQIKSTEELVSASEKSAPEGTYDIPKNYKKKKL